MDSENLLQEYRIAITWIHPIKLELVLEVMEVMRELNVRWRKCSSQAHSKDLILITYGIYMVQKDIYIRSSMQMANGGMPSYL